MVEKTCGKGELGFESGMKQWMCGGGESGEQVGEPWLFMDFV